MAGTVEHNSRADMVASLGREPLHSPRSEFLAKLEERWELGNFVCVGLDTDFTKLPQSVIEKAGSRVDEAILEFNRNIIDATADLVCAYKPNSAFYEAWGNQGIHALQLTTDYIHDRHPNIPVILDAKRADIGKTNSGYCRFAFDYLGADGTTVNPYLGEEALRPFLERGDKGIIVLAKTSNPGAGEFQDMPVDLSQLTEAQKKTFFKGEGDLEELKFLAGMPDTVPLCQLVAYRVAKYWDKLGNCGLVVGATYPEELAQIRKIAGRMPILLPGVGAQGAEVEATVKNGQDDRGWGMIINSSSGIIYASKGSDFAQAARQETIRLREQINQFRTH